MHQNLKTIISIFVFMLLVKASNAQNFLTQDKVWSDYYYSDNYGLYDENGKLLAIGGGYIAKITTWRKVGADSLIEGTLYKQILSSRDSLMENWYLYAFMREEGNKVFRYGTNGKSEHLLYDFGMQPGDTLFDGNAYVTTVLKSIRDTLMDKPRKLFTFSKNSCDFPEREEIWIEGIGALQGGLFRPLYDFTTGFEGYIALICYSENGELVYHNADYDECYYNEIKPFSDMSIPEIKAQSGVLTQNSPNPFTKQTKIKYFVANDVKEAYIGIFDMQGKMLQRISVAPGQNSIMIQGSNLAAGMYMYSLIVDRQVVDTKRMILTNGR